MTQHVGMQIVGGVVGLLAVLLALTWRWRRLKSLEAAQAKNSELDAQIKKLQSGISRLTAERDNYLRRLQQPHPTPFFSNADRDAYQEQIRGLNLRLQEAQDCFTLLTAEKEELAKQLNEVQQRLEVAEAGRKKAVESEDRARASEQHLEQELQRQREEWRSNLHVLESRIDEVKQRERESLHRQDESVRQLMERIVQTVHAWRAETLG